MDEIIKGLLILSSALLMLTILVYVLTKDNWSKGYFSGAFIAVLLCCIIYGTTEKPKSTTYECPCGVTEIVTDEVVHYNKSTGDTTITTYIDVSNCIKQSK